MFLQRRWLLALVFVSLILLQLPETLAQQGELVMNGGFESGDFTGWSHTNSRVVSQSEQGYYDAMSHPPHSGRYSAEVGSAARLGTISQQISIPAKSVATFVAWYRLEQGSSLMIYLKNPDGSTIKQWSESGSQSWTTVSYDLDVTYAGQTITIEFDGQGNEQLTTVYGYCVDSAGNYYPCTYPTYADYFPFVDDVSLHPTLTQYVATINAPDLPPELATKLYVDGTQVGNIQGQRSVPLTFKIGESHTISIDGYVYKDNTTRYYCANDTVTVSSDVQVTFTYKPQYYLSIRNGYGQETGNDWYNGGSTATFSLRAGAVPMPGLAGVLGAKLVFEKWTGSAETSSIRGNITMTGPASISANWKTDYTTLLFAAGLIVILAIVGVMAYVRLTRKRKRRESTQLYEITPTKEMEITDELNSKEDETEIKEMSNDTARKGSRTTSKDGEISDQRERTRHRQKHRE
jgi:hypothetical protein